MTGRLELEKDLSEKELIGLHQSLIEDELKEKQSLIAKNPELWNEMKSFVRASIKDILKDNPQLKYSINAE